MANTSDKSDWRQERPLYLFLAIAGLIISLVANFIPADFGKIEITSLVNLDKQVLLNNPKLEKVKGGEKILLQIKGYDKMFQITGFDFGQTIKRNILNNIHAGDTISLKIESSEFKSRYHETIFDKFVEIHALTKNGIEYLNIGRAITKIHQDSKFVIPLGLYLAGAGLIYWSFKSRPKISPSIVIGTGAIILILVVQQ